MINADFYIRWYLTITCHFITPTLLRFLRHPCNLMNYALQYARQNRLIYNIFLNIFNAII
jgi:hypothetical protein